MDPLAEKYYSISPYAYCAGDPVNIVDFVGKAWYKIDSNGYITLYDERKEDDYDVLFKTNNDGGIDPHGALRVNDRSILSSLADHSETKNVSNRTDLLNVFFFVADNSKVEWGLYSSEQGNILKTSHRYEGVSEPDFFPETNSTKIHSHPKTNPTTKDEYDSMGFWLSKYNYDESGNIILNKKLIKENELGDWRNYIKAYEKYGNKAAKSFVYFPQSRRIYRINYNSRPTLINTR